mmetsp:Transcript_19918/g.46348  ORF Transcript_19918/g.46348 Transcript_19918/m.46348 type:complete len:88 (+) Transcript_19918:205-468(+)
MRSETLSEDRFKERKKRAKSLRQRAQNHHNKPAGKLRQSVKMQIPCPSKLRNKTVIALDSGSYPYSRHATSSCHITPAATSLLLGSS